MNSLINDLSRKKDENIYERQLLPFVNNQFVDLPYSRNLQERHPLESEHILVGFNWSHRFTDDWSITNTR